MFRTIRVAVICLIFLSALSAGALSADVRTKEMTAGFKAGLINPGTFWVGDYDSDSDLSYHIGGFMDYKLGPRISGGLVLNFSNFSYRDDSSNMLELGFMIKAWLFSEESNLTFTPGFGISYGHLGDNGYVDASDFLIINGLVDMIIGMETYDLLLELGITGSPTGGNDDWDMSYGPGFFFRGGMIF
ncbi:MAG: hypothetical protein R6U43_05970 [Candidatus Krumholzibacteriales bacterium]